MLGLVMKEGSSTFLARPRRGQGRISHPKDIYPSPRAIDRRPPDTVLTACGKRPMPNVLNID
jgi:hypothetical protein